MLTIFYVCNLGFMMLFTPILLALGFENLFMTCFIFGIIILLFSTIVFGSLGWLDERRKVKYP
jgi:UDP-N-acetylmuramyl pentapeptide phosphotransferase/UDP-N-acetylglucosamine-1-phosphate transferase